MYTRTGANGVRQVDVRGLVAAAFTHRDSRAGDPDLHTHVAVANKVQTLDGRWLSIDGRLLFKATVAASETYNTALEAHLSDTLGVRFAERPNPDPRKRPIREIVGVDPRLNQRWSTRRVHIEARRGELATQFQRRPRPAAHPGRNRCSWPSRPRWRPATRNTNPAPWPSNAPPGGPGRRGSRRRPTRSGDMVDRALGTDPISGVQVDRAVDSARRPTACWRRWRAPRDLAGLARPRRSATPGPRRRGAPATRPSSWSTGSSTRSSTAGRCPWPDPPTGSPNRALLRRADGASVYTVAGADLYTSTRGPGRRTTPPRTSPADTDGRTVDEAAVDVALLEMTANGTALNAGQAGLVRAMATSGARLQLAIAPAGTGKTTAMHALAAAWTSSGGQVIGLAPSAAAAAQLRDQIDSHTDTLAKLTWSIHHDDLPDWVVADRSATLGGDRRGRDGRHPLPRHRRPVHRRSGWQCPAGRRRPAARRDRRRRRPPRHPSHHGAVRLTELLRFTDPAEAAATLALRDGRPEALGFYLDHHRIHVGDLTTVTDELFAAWQADRKPGSTRSCSPPPANSPPTSTTAPAPTASPKPHVQIQTAPAARGTVELADGNQASVGDLVITRSNDRRLR